MQPDGSLPIHVKEKMKDFIDHTGESNYFDDIYNACEKAGDGKAFNFNEELLFLVAVTFGWATTTLAFV